MTNRTPTLLERGAAGRLLWALPVLALIWILVAWAL